MPNVPDAASLGLGSGPGKIVPLQGRLNVQASPADFGAQQAQVIGQFGEQLGQIGGQLYRAQQAVQERDDRIAANKFGLDARLELTKWLETAKQSAPAGAEGFTDTVMKHVEEYKAEHLKEVKPGLYRSLVEDDLSRYQISIFEEASGFQTQAKRANAEVQIKGSLDSALAYIAMRPEEAGNVLGKLQRDVIEPSGMAPERKAAVMQEITHAAAEAGWRSRLRQDPLNTLAMLRSDDGRSGLAYDDNLRLQREAETVLREQENDRRTAAAEARSLRAEQRSIAAEGRAIAAEGRQGVEDALTAGILAGTAGPAEILKAVQHRAISGDQARTLTNFVEAKNKPATVAQDDPLALQFMLRASTGDANVVGDAAQAVAQGRLSLDTFRQIQNDLQERQRTGGIHAREDVKEGEASLRRVIEEAGPLGNISGDKAQKSLNAVRMFRDYMTEHTDADPLEVADRVGKIWKNSFNDVPRSRYLVQAPGQPPDLDASIKRLQTAIAAGTLSEMEVELETEALERAAAAVEQKKRGR